MEGNLGCYNNEVKVQLTISNTSLSSGNKKVTNDLMSGFFFLAYCLSKHH